MEKLRLKDFNPETVAPHFLNFLRQKGEVEIGKENEEIERLGISKEEEMHKGLWKSVSLNGQEIGKLECHIDPPTILYHGRLPDVQKPKYTQRKTMPRPIIDEQGIAWTNVRTRYQEMHPKSTFEGRYDGWTTIPFP